MTPEQIKRVMSDQPCCACLTVSYKPIRHETYIEERWACNLCDRTFYCRSVSDQEVIDTAIIKAHKQEIERLNAELNQYRDAGVPATVYERNRELLREQRAYTTKKIENEKLQARVDELESAIDRYLAEQALK